MAQQARTPRTATPERWAQALERARAEGLVSYCIGGDPRHHFVTSGTATGTGYLVNIVAGLPTSCLCPAGEHDPVCKHRALILDKLGMLPAAPARPAATVPDLDAARARKAAAMADLYGAGD